VITFEVNDMTCGHCASTIAKSVKAVDQDARVEVDLGSHQVRIDAAVADIQTLKRAIEAAGYTAVPLGAAGSAVAAQPSSRCCG
jgi:copper chaperone